MPEERREAMKEGMPTPVGTPVSFPYRASLIGNIEQALKALQGYGIMALELIQNADDAKAKALVFDAQPDWLRVFNSATFTSCGLASPECPWERDGDRGGIRRPCNFHAIGNLGSRSKIHAPGQTGRFGIGFVSVYQVTDTPFVRSAGMELELDPLAENVSARVVDAAPGTEFLLPWAFERSRLRDELHASPVPADVAARFVEEVTSDLPSSVLFLRHLERVEIRLAGALRLAIDIERSPEGITLRHSPGNESERWLLLQRDASDIIVTRDLWGRFEILATLDRSKTVSVALPVSAGPIEGRLYAYLPTRRSSGMQLHVNGDFFPHASRREIVLSGDGHERHWNETLLAAAAAAVGENLLRLRDTLGHERLWRLGSDALNLKSEGPFAAFWPKFADAARLHPSVFTAAGEWHLPAGVHVVPGLMPGPEADAVGSIGVTLLHDSLRSYRKALSAVEVTDLRLETLVGRLEALEGEGISDDNPHLRPLWAAVARLLEAIGGSVDPALAKRVKAARFLIDRDGGVVSPDDVWRMPPGVSGEHVVRCVPVCPIVHPDVLVHPSLQALIDEYTLGRFALDLSAELITAAITEERAGGGRTRDFYSLLVAFPADQRTPTVGALLRNRPVLRTAMGFIEPARAQLPGDFTDPTGYFALIDISLFPQGMDEFARSVLKVDVLTFAKYLNDHLPEILRRGIKKEQYQSLLAQIFRSKNELDEAGAFEALSRQPFVRTRAGNYVRPSDCYFWSANLEAVLGTTPGRWVSEDWMPSGKAGAPLRDVLEARLGMRVTAAAQHVVARLQELARSGTPEELDKSATPVVRHLVEWWDRFSKADREELGKLRSVAFLPALVDGERNPDTLYRPTEVLRAARALGFSSQVPVIDLAPLRRSGESTEALLELLGVKEEPATAVVVEHLRHCISTGTPPHDLTYAMLSERFERNDDLPAIDQLRAEPFIFNPAVRRFLPASRVYWQSPPFAGHFWSADSKMRLREPLYRRLGVRDKPQPEDYAALMVEIVAIPDRNAADRGIHAGCLTFLCEAFARGDDVEGAITQLRGEPSLLNVDGEVLWSTDDAIWNDAAHLVEPFGTSLNQTLLERPAGVGHGDAARFFDRVGVRPVSRIVRTRLAAPPDGTPAETELEVLHDRADLLLWLAPDPSFAARLRDVLADVDVRLTASLSVQAEIDEFDPPVRSPVASAAAFLEPDTLVLHVRGSSMRGGWPAAFRELFSYVAEDTAAAELKALPMSAVSIITTESRGEAKQMLLDSGYRPPEEPDADVIAAGTELEALPDNDPGDVAEDHNWPGDSGGGSDQVEDEAEQAETDEGAGPGDTGDEAEASSDDAGRSESLAAAAESARGPGALPAVPVGAGSDINSSGSDLPNHSGPAESTGTKPPQSRPGATGSAKSAAAERAARRSRMLAYVIRSGDGGAEHTDAGRENADLSGLIDDAAITMALKFETDQGRVPEEQPHGNPGYDILSTATDGRRRIIEVKGLESEWTERGVKLTAVQYGMAEEYGDEYWVYIVEHAPDLNRQRLFAIANPFQKVGEYWFDHNWREASEEGTSARRLNLRVGARVSREHWGTGQIVEVNEVAGAPWVIVDFGREGKKHIPFDATLHILPDTTP